MIGRIKSIISLGAIEDILIRIHMLLNNAFDLYMAMSFSGPGDNIGCYVVEKGGRKKRTRKMRWRMDKRRNRIRK